MKKTVEETYVMMDQREHVLARPGMYIGSVKKEKKEEWVFSENKIKKKDVEFSPGFVKIFDEVIANAIDHSVKDETVTKIKVDINKETGEITIFNDGSGIPVVIHSENGMYIPEMIFGNLLSGSNYNDDEERLVAGTNGVGIKATNIFSKKFTIETVDSINKKKFTQTFSKNMLSKKEPKVSSNSTKSYTKITFTPDYEKFGMDGIDDESYSILARRVHECMAITRKSVSIYLNGTKLLGKGLLDYTKFFFEEKPISSEIVNGWEYIVFQSNVYQQVSFVNGNNTSGGGKHVDCIMNQIIAGVKSKMKDDTIKPSLIKENIFIFLNSTVNNPSFSSQTKDVLTTSQKDFGRSIKVSDLFIKNIYKSPITREILDTIAFKNRKKLDKDVSSVKKSSINVKNLDDATYAGTFRSSESMIILTEGLSASSFAIAGLAIVGRKKYGVYALKGKVLNTREATQSQLVKNEEILALKKIIGLSNSKTYESKEELSTLRYGCIGILADSDLDGVHISSLIMNFIHYWWPALIKKEGFIKTIKTPIVKLRSGNIVKKFYNETDYENFMKTQSSSKWTMKFYKGLGTSTAAEAKEVFKELDLNTEIYTSDPKVDSSFELAFDKKKSNDRKSWLSSIPKEHATRDKENKLTYSDFINKELIYFSSYDNVRSIPNIMDGLKPSQRKVLYTAFKRNIKKEIKVAQFGASVAEETAYHHGEVSLSSTIIGMAQDYTGSNNMNLLEPCGNFGYRNHNGKDAASPRYIFTHLSKNSDTLFCKDDEYILEYNTDDGKRIEPKFYTPSLPIVLINGTVGIGTGYSTNIPSYNPKDIIENIKLIVNKKKPKNLVPWYSGFKGTITPDENGSFVMKGLVTRNTDKTLLIEEIPINTSISEYKDFLESNEDFSTVNESTENSPRFVLKFKQESELEKYNYKNLKLISKINTTNMNLFGVDGRLKKYNDPNEIIVEFLKVKLEYLTKRKLFILDKYKNDLISLKNKKRFLEDIIENRLDVYRKSKKDIDNILLKNKFDSVEKSFNYLTNMSISSFTIENLDILEKNIRDIETKYNVANSKSNVDMMFDEIIYI